jgi:hypothetical protein
MTKHKAYTLVNKKYVDFFCIRQTAKEAKSAFLGEEHDSWDLQVARGWRVCRVEVTLVEDADNIADLRKRTEVLEHNIKILRRENEAVIKRLADHKEHLK